MPDRHIPPSLQRAVQQTLESLQRAGVAQLPKPSAACMLAAPDAAADLGLAAMPNESSPDGQPALNLEIDEPKVQTPMLSTEQRRNALEIIAQKVSACTKCRELAETRTQTVFGVGNPQAQLCFIGEAPGADEDRQGEPFVGRAGQLLTKIIEACTLRREDVYIMNILKCRPPGNRNPSSAESDNCREFLHLQLDTIAPQFICCLGSVAAQNLLETNQSIGRLRGRLHLYRGIQVLATYHPAYLLRNPSAKRQVWEDMQILLKEMGINPPTRESS